MKVVINNVGNNSIIGSFIASCMRWSDEAVGRKEINYPADGTTIDFYLSIIHGINLTDELNNFRTAFPKYKICVHYNTNI